MDLKSKLKFYLNINKNVLLVGESGVGKTVCIKQVFEESGINWVYLNAATLDPYVDFIGIPKESNGKLDFIRPSYMSEDIEAIYIDELNRGMKQTRNAVLELIQFKSINGYRFPNLKVVWSSINPEEDGYDVERLDIALKERFHVKINVPFLPDRSYFENKYNDIGDKLCDWWDTIPINHKNKISPRTLDYIGDIYQAGGDIRDVVPEDINVLSLIESFQLGSFKTRIERFFNKKNKEESAHFVNNYYGNIENYILDNTEYARYFLHLLNKEKLTSLFEDKDFGRRLVKNYFNDIDRSSMVDTFFSYKNIGVKIYDFIHANEIPPIESSFYLWNKTPEIRNKSNIKIDYRTLATEYKRELKAAKSDNRKAVRTKYINKCFDATGQILEGSATDFVSVFCKTSHYSSVAEFGKELAALYNKDFHEDKYMDINIYHKFYGAKLLGLIKR